MIKIGDKVRMSKKKIIGIAGTYIPEWYCNEIFSIKNIRLCTGSSTIVTLDRNLPNRHGNEIYIGYLKSLRIQRKKKLLKLNSL